MPANLRNSTVATGLEKVSFDLNSKKSNTNNVQITIPLHSFQSQRTVLLKKVQTTTQLYSFYMLVRLCSRPFKLGFKSTQAKNFQMYKLDLEKAEEPEVKF